ncbi:hypothetical protein [Kribbella sp. CA-247076]|uniref:hypothetical protein n=1 Tax=Kribbella sp. CA-247076 TaxID=3239941 RepID=UPI003D89CE3E
MGGYPVVWRILCTALVAAGVLLGVVVLPLEVWVLVALLAVVLGLTAIVGRDRPTQPVPSARGGARPVLLLVRAVGVGLAVAAVLAFAVVLRAGVVVLVVMVIASSSPAVGWWRRLLRKHARSAESRVPAPVESRTQASPADSAVLALPAADLTTSQLCRQWHDSYLALRQAPPAQRLRLVMIRQQYLDELERRDPRGLRAWFDSAASAGGDPSRFLTTTHSDVPPDQHSS